MTEQQQKTFPLLSILTIIFVVAKIWGPLTWSWLWVLSPLWIPIAIFTAICLGGGLIMLVCWVITQF